MNYSNSVVLIPAYNEEKNIAQVICGIKENLNDIDILVVDDGSSDNTCQIANTLGATVITHAFNMGYGAALQTGFKYALENDYHYLVHIDADGQHDPHYIKTMLSELFNKRADVIIGSRYLDQDSYRPGFLRWLGVKLFSSIVSIVIRKKISDPTSGYQAMNRKVFSLFSQEIYPIDYPDADVIMLLYYRGFKIKEVPVLMTENREKSMHSGLSPLYYIFKMLLSIFVTFLREKEAKKYGYST